MASSLQSYIPSFSKKLDELDAGKLSIAAYPANYLQLLLQHKLYYLHIYAHLLENLLHNIDTPKQEIVLVDYGAGNGLLGMFAKHCGFGTIYLNDHSAMFIQASQQLASTMSISIDGFINGDWSEWANFFTNNVKPDAIIGTDVIEHIYNLEGFFNEMHLLNPKMVSVLTTASVTSNPFKSKQLMRLQHTDELYGSNLEQASPNDEFAGLPFIETRKKMIVQTNQQLSPDNLHKIAVATRGMNKDDIIRTVREFMATGKLPKPLVHPTNTCDPVTGSWTERLLTSAEYSSIYKKAGFSLLVHNGFYNQWQSGLKSIILKMMNKILALPGGQGKFVTPFITLVGKKK